MITYNNNNKNINVGITRHAVFQMQERYNKLFDKKITAAQAEQQIIKRFPGCNRLKNFKPIEKKRVKKYPGTTLFFRDLDFTFIVQDAKIRSVEISRIGKRHLNKTSGHTSLLFSKEEIQEAKEFLKTVPKFKP